MPHCVVECPDSIEGLVQLDALVSGIHDAADATGLFDPGDVKVRLHKYRHWVAGGRKDAFVHVTIGLLGGRSAAQKRSLSAAVAATICDMLPTVHYVSVDVRDFDVEAYANRLTLNRPVPEPVVSR